MAEVYDYRTQWNENQSAWKGDTARRRDISAALECVPHWFETLAMAEARRTRQDMVLVRYADDFFILSFKLKQDFIESIERGLEGRFGLTINREKTKIFNMRETHGDLVHPRSR